MMLPGTILFIIFSYLPMFGTVIAFKEINYGLGFFNSPWVGLKNFKFLVNSPDFIGITRNTVVYNLIFIALGLVVSVAIAVALSELRNKRLNRFYQTTMLLPYFLSWITASYLLYSFLNARYGVVNQLLMKLFGVEGPDWYSTLSAWPFLLVFLNLWKYTGYRVVIYLAAITSIDTDYYEAAAIDGASKWQQITKITLPSLVPLMIILTILALSNIFHGDFGLFYQATMRLGEGILKPVGDVIDTYVYIALMEANDLGMSSAAGLYQAVVGFLLVLVTNYFIRKVDKEKSLF
ncbi:MAG: ABC transporter permease [Bacteroidota bacterium]